MKTGRRKRPKGPSEKTELLFLALILRMLQPGGRAAVIVPDGVLFGSTKAHQEIRKTIVNKHKLDAVISMPSGVFKPYAGVSTAILFFTKPILAARIMSGFMTCRQTVSRLMISARQ